MSIQFRPHHFLCTLCFQGKGYSPKFIRNYENIVKQLNTSDGDELLIEVTEHTDSICAPCPHKREILCESQAKIERLDKAHAAALDIKAGDKLTWPQAKQRIAQQMTIEKFHQICEPCNWKSLGLCEGALTGFLTEIHNKP
jgi:hypothetical protein